MHAYELVIPPPWTQVGLRRPAGASARVMEFVDKAIDQLPREVPPDQVGPLRRSLEHKVSTAVAQARESGGIDLFLPTESWHGFHNGSSFIVAQVAPVATPPAEVSADNYAALVMADLLTQPETRTVHTANAVWVRTERVHPAGTVSDVDTPTVSVDYLTPLPDTPGSWIGVMFSTIGDGNPTSEPTRLSVELFDAIMSTWIWIDEPSGSTPASV